MVAVLDEPEARSKRVSSEENADLLVLYEISKVLCSCLDLQRSINDVLNILSAHHREVRRCMLSLVQDSGELHVVGASGLSREEIGRGRFGAGEGITGSILKTGMPIVVPDISKEPRFLNRTAARTVEEQARLAFIGVPIKSGPDVLGVISFEREFQGRRRSFENDVRFLQMVANLIGQSIRLQKKVAAEREFLMAEKFRLQKALPGKYRIDHMIGTSSAMQRVFADVHQAAQGRGTVLLRGQSGTGKELIARAIHELSKRKSGPFIKVNCAALSETLLESELFGHEKGAFTGATQDRKGRFELANGGTLFLDEIGDVSPSFQAKLLRVLQEREFERVGGTRTLKVDVRLIGATNRNLEEAVAKGEYREDLYFRLNVITISLPPLRERREDIPPLVEHFLQRFNEETGRGLVMSPGAMDILKNCPWPGNVRELENCVERLATMSRSNVVQALDIACQKDMCFSLALQQHAPKSGRPILVPVVSRPIEPPHGENDHAGSPSDACLVDGRSSSSERDRILWAMEQCGWVQAKAARLLNLTPRQIGYALQKYNIPIKKL